MTEEIKPVSPQISRGLWLEIGLVLLTCVIPYLYTAIVYFVTHSLSSESSTAANSNSFIYGSVEHIIRSIGIIALISFIIARSGEGAAKFGISRLRLYDFAGAIGVFIALHIGNYALWRGLTIIMGIPLATQFARHDFSAISGPQGAWQFAVLAIRCLTNGIAEELVCRSYMITRFEQAFRSTPVALLLSSNLFGSYHIYQGTGGAITAFGVGLTFGLIFIVFRSFWPLAIGHALQDLIAIGMLGK